MEEKKEKKKKIDISLEQVKKAISGESIYRLTQDFNELAGEINKEVQIALFAHGRLDKEVKALCEESEIKFKEKFRASVRGIFSSLNTVGADMLEIRKLILKRVEEDNKRGVKEH